MQTDTHNAQCCTFVQRHFLVIPKISYAYNFLQDWYPFADYVKCAYEKHNAYTERQ
jgi:hypothetical protein